jgi:N-methylhydantoinase A
MRVGVDIGGTFTDLVVSVDGQLHVHKLLSTPDDPSRAMLAGLNHIAPTGLTGVVHGTTVATNAILERRGAKVALITTMGYRDVLAIGRQNRPDLYALYPTIPAPLVPREQCYGLTERLDANGNVLTPLDKDHLAQILDALEAQGIEAVAVSLLYSYLNPDHELAVRDAILVRGLLDDGQIALSHEILPEFREYERASTVSLEAYVRPVMSRYLSNLEQQLPDGVGLRVMKSDGGVVSAKRAASQSVQTALSGPAAGVIGAHHLATLAGYPNIITLDMGGTSTDVALVAGEPIRRPESEIDGLPLRIRLLDIDTVGAGGGSIARIDSGGALRVGPQSAGSSPGPIAYGKAGSAVTVTDANVVLGRLDADHFLGGTMPLNVTGASAAVEALGNPVGLSATETAQGIIDIANVNIDRALRRVSVARGHDPREFTLVAFGGAGPLHACEVAERLEMAHVLIPRTPGVLCAFGLLVADVVLDYSRAVLRLVDGDLYDDLRAIVTDLQTQAASDLSDDGVLPADQRFTVMLDARYQGQGYELSIPLTADIAETFHAAHSREYGHALDAVTVEVVNLRLTATGTVEHPSLDAEPEIDNDGGDALIRIRADGVRLYDRNRLSPGARFSGPALVFQLDSTVYIAAGWQAHVDNYTNLLLHKG